MLTSKPAAAFNTDNDFYSVYVRGSDGAVWGRDYNGAWGAWYRTGGVLLAGTGPAAAYDATDYVLVVGIDRQLYIHRTGVTGFTAAGGVTNSTPALVNAPSSGSLVGFARGTNSAGFFHRFLAATPGWQSMGGVLTSGMAASATTTNWYAYGLGTDTQVWEHPGTTCATGSWARVTP